MKFCDVRSLQVHPFQVLSMTFGGHRLTLIRGRQPIVDGEEVDLTPGFYSNSFLYIVNNELLTMIIFQNGIDIIYDGGDGL